jgi:hypothetical protein
MLEHFTEQVQLPILEYLHASAKKHAAKSNGLLVALEPDITKYRHQSLLEPIVRSSGQLATTESLTPIAQALRPEYSLVVDAIRSHDSDQAENDRAMNQVAHVLKTGHNVIFGHDHGEDVITFAMNAAASTNVLRDQEVSFRPGLLASKMLDFLAIDLKNFGSHQEGVEKILSAAGVEISENGIVHARNVLIRVFSVVYLTIPNTRTSQEFRRVHQTGIKIYNNHVRQEINSDMQQSRLRKRKPPYKLDIAMSGAINTPMDVRKFHQTKRLSGLYDFDSNTDHDDFEEGKVEVVGGIAEGVLSFSAHALTYAVVEKMKAKKPFFDIDPAHIALTDDESLRILGIKQISLLDKNEPDVVHVYDHGRSLPLVRASMALEE